MNAKGVRHPRSLIDSVKQRVTNMVLAGTRESSHRPVLKVVHLAELLLQLDLIEPCSVIAAHNCENSLTDEYHH